MAAVSSPASKRASPASSSALAFLSSTSELAPPPAAGGAWANAPGAEVSRRAERAARNADFGSGDIKGLVVIPREGTEISRIPLPKDGDAAAAAWRTGLTQGR